MQPKLVTSPENAEWGVQKQDRMPQGWHGKDGVVYKVYTKRRRDKRAKPNGFATDSLERAKDVAQRERASWWGQNGVYDWIRIKDTETGKYIYEA